MGKGAKWFGRVMWLGILFNLCFAIPAIFAPDMVLAGLDLPPATSMLWLQNVGMLLVDAVHLLYPFRRQPRDAFPRTQSSWFCHAGSRPFFGSSCCDNLAQPALSGPCCSRTSHWRLCFSCCLIPLCRRKVA